MEAIQATEAPAILDYLKTIEALQPVPEEQLKWLIDRLEKRQLKPGDMVFKKGDPTDRMIIVYKGKADIKFEQNGQLRPVGTLEEGNITGLLPYSRMKTAGGYSTAIVDTELLMLHKDHFKPMEQECHELVQALVSLMTTRVREFTRTQQQNEKMISLGKLSAGLAHELNNPASAMARSSQELRNRLRLEPENFKGLMSMKISEEQVDAVNQVVLDKIVNCQSVTLSLMEKTALEDDLLDWFDDHGVDDGDLLAENFAESNMTIDDLDQVSNILKGEFLTQVFKWMDNTLASQKLMNEIEEAATRIETLVKSIKTYSHMDRAPDKEPTNIQEGIQSTLTMLNHKLKAKDIEVKFSFPDPMPVIKAFVSDLNQVWTNLIDNAIDAMEEKGVLEIKVTHEGDNLVVCVVDNGKGIPEDIVGQIFDPFFTTKGVGQGTGLGLDIVSKIIKQHGADIKVRSKPGNTEFRLCFIID